MFYGTENIDAGLVECEGTLSYKNKVQVRTGINTLTIPNVRRAKLRKGCLERQ